jgi:hypothetical protein
VIDEKCLKIYARNSKKEFLGRPPYFQLAPEWGGGIPLFLSVADAKDKANEVSPFGGTLEK